MEQSSSILIVLEVLELGEMGRLRIRALNKGPLYPFLLARDECGCTHALAEAS
jgi:hypothetical protein